jgi:hypothetical protein
MGTGADGDMVVWGHLLSLVGAGEDGFVGGGVGIDVTVGAASMMVARQSVVEQKLKDFGTEET